jgi:hypothetical protein
MSLEMAHKVILPPKKNYIPQFLKQRDINSYNLYIYSLSAIHRKVRKATILPSQPLSLILSSFSVGVRRLPILAGRRSGRGGANCKQKAHERCLFQHFHFT